MILIIGAGVSGLSAAASIQGDSIVVEREGVVGGYCRTTKRNGYVWDRAGHFFHFRNARAKRFFDRSIPREEFIESKKNTTIYFDKFGHIDFPFQKNIHQLPKDEYIRCLTGLYLAESQGLAPGNFKEFIHFTMGEGISDIFLRPYNEKLYATDLNNLDVDAMGRFFPTADFKGVLLNARDEQSSESYNATFSYPRNGAEVFVDVLHEAARKNSTIKLNTKVISLDIESRVAKLSNGDSISYTQLVSTMPLPSLIEKSGLTNQYPLEPYTWNKVLVFNIGYDEPPLIDRHWVYYPGSEVFYRVGCYSNIRGSGPASLYVEIGLSSQEHIDVDGYYQRVLSDLIDVGFVSKSARVVDYEVVVMDPAYVHISKASEAAKGEALMRLKAKGIYSIGRYGRWTYCSIEDNIIEATQAASELVKNSNGAHFLDFMGLGDPHNEEG